MRGYTLISTYAYMLPRNSVNVHAYLCPDFDCHAPFRFLSAQMLSPDPNSRPGAKDLVKIARARRRKKKEQSRDGSENEAWVDRSHSE